MAIRGELSRCVHAPPSCPCIIYAQNTWNIRHMLHGTTSASFKKLDAGHYSLPLYVEGYFSSFFFMCGLKKKEGHTALEQHQRE